MSEIVTVSAADVQVVNDVLAIAARAFGSTFQHIPHFGDALEAVNRMAMAVQQSKMPEDPVSDAKATGITYHELLAAYCEAGFDEHYAFELVKIHAQAVAQLSLMRAMHG